MSAQHDLDSSLHEDQKNFRKLRKILRQIEHLKILPRALNKDEESKVAKRKYYREQLDALNLKYEDQTELLHEKEPNEENSSFFLNESATAKEEELISSITVEMPLVPEEVAELDEEEQVVESPQQTVLPTETKKTKKKAGKGKKSKENDDIDELSARLDKIALDTVKEKPVEKKEAPKEIIKPAPKVEQRILPEKPKKVLPKVSFETKSIDDAHEDLIVSIDVCTEYSLIVTGSRDTTIKVWSMEGEMLHSFGGHSKSLTFVKFWPYKSYVKVLENLRTSQNEDLDLPDFEEATGDSEETEAEVESKRQPLILSSSLDCSLRLWYVYKGYYYIYTC